MAFHIAVHPEECWDALRTRRKLLACVLMVGGGPTSSPGWGMGQRWDHHSSDEYNNDDNETQVITSPRDTPGDSVVWRGAANTEGRRRCLHWFAFDKMFSLYCLSFWFVSKY